MKRLLLVFLPLVAVACGDPVRDQQREALGDERPGVPAGPLHRPGQPCLVCHDGEGPGNSEFSLAGTVYQIPTATVPLGNALVRFIDSSGKKYETGTNCAGNFFVMRADYDPAFPVWVKIVFGHIGPTPVEHPMGSPIYREGSCAKCHGDKPGSQSVGRVWFAEQPIPGVECH